MVALLITVCSTDHSWFYLTTFILQTTIALVDHLYHDNSVVFDLPPLGVDLRLALATKRALVPAIRLSACTGSAVRRQAWDPPRHAMSSLPHGSGRDADGPRAFLFRDHVSFRFLSIISLQMVADTHF